ncbi:MAG: PSD1 and planctomycete cytochrome C domain-containing protein [Pirellula sp.]|nr:PSD1 and planctomycete cytochrome C domain-containing protein [Pirellula sp.]
MMKTIHSLSTIRVWTTLVGSFACMTACMTLSTLAFSADIDFSRDIKPLLAEHCLKCHGPDKAEGGLDLSRRESAIAKTESGEFAIVSSNPEHSTLLRRVSSQDPDERMPPPEEKTLDAKQIALLRTWIEKGAEYQEHWSFRPLQMPIVPTVNQENWAKSPIDRFVLHDLEAKGIQPSREAKPHVLLRRLYLDLIGLLPTPSEVDAFRADHALNADAAVEKVIDRLLSSEHFGERWGRHWLDLARYADSDGYEKDRNRPDAYIYRDWVIQALNNNMPFDQFTIEQLAGDQLPNATPNQRIATAFNRQTLTNTEGGTDQEEFRIASTFDRTDTVGSVWLGLTVGCAKCHTHKYDPIPHTDYYRLFAFFNEAEEQAIKLPTRPADDPSQLSELAAAHEELQSYYRTIYPAEQKWEAEQREIVEQESNAPLVVESQELEIGIHSEQGLVFERQSDASFLARIDDELEDKGKETPETDTYTLTLSKLPADLTGLRLETIPDEGLPKGGSGLAANGNLVVSHVAAQIIDREGTVVRELPLQRAEADFEQKDFKAADTIAKKVDPKKGWAVSPKQSEPHWLQWRTKGPTTLQDGERLRLKVAQLHGKEHLLGRFRIKAITGDSRDLHLTKEVINALKMYPEKRLYETRMLLFDFYVQQDDKAQSLIKKIDAIHKKWDSKVVSVRVLTDAYTERPTYRFDRGDFLSPAEQVQPGILTALQSGHAEAQRLRRLDLARWLVGPENSLTPRVIANQFWSRLFGAGIVRSVGDFGVRGETPSHPELLDWLAVTYRDTLRWDTKAFLKTILMSSTYRQSSTHRPEMVDLDPVNRWLSRQNRLRVEAELVRDLALQVSGLLSNKVGGPSVFPSMPPELAKLSYNNSFTWTNSEGEDRYRRGLYTFFKRTIPHPTLITFDCPDANQTCVNRNVSNTPIQALALLNNDSFVEASLALAKKIVTEAGSDKQKLEKAFEICLTRGASDDELAKLTRLLQRSRAYYLNEPEAAKSVVGDKGSPAKEASTIENSELAAWTATLRVLINLDEFITRE